MLKIDIEIDLPAFEKEVDDHMARTFQPAVVEALNKAGEIGRDAVQKGLNFAFDHPNPLTISGVDIMNASVRTDGGDSSVLICIKDRTASYLDLYVTGGTRRVGDAFTTRRGPMVPGPKAPRDSFGNLPWGYIAEAMFEPDVAGVTLQAGKPLALVRRKKGQPPEVLVLIVKEVLFEAERSTSTGSRSGPHLIRLSRLSPTLSTSRIWPGMHRGYLHPDGHSHAALRETLASLDVGVDCWEWAPVSLPHILRRMADTPDIP